MLLGSHEGFHQHQQSTSSQEVPFAVQSNALSSKGLGGGWGLCAGWFELSPQHCTYNAILPQNHVDRPRIIQTPRTVPLPDSTISMSVLSHQLPAGCSPFAPPLPLESTGLAFSPTSMWHTGSGCIPSPVFPAPGERSPCVNHSRLAVSPHDSCS